MEALSETSLSVCSTGRSRNIIRDLESDARTQKPSRKYRKGSQYDPVIDAFMECDYDLVKIEVQGKDANHRRTQLNKRFEVRNLTGIKVSVVNIRYNQ